MTSQTPIAPRRRNGRPQACEPCRKRKAACDHNLPICLRCRNRRTEKDCVYLAAPMTRPSGSRSHQGVSGQQVPITPSATESSSSAVGSPASRTSIGFQPQGLGRANRFFTDSSGFLGPTSFSATLLDDSEGLDPLPANNDTQTSLRTGQAPNNGLNGPTSVLSDRLIKLGMQVIEQIPDEQTARALHEKCCFPDDGVSNLASTNFIKGLWSFVGNSPRTPEHCRSLVDQITSNTAIPLQDNGDSTQWIDSLTGSNLRWEVLGTLFSCWAASVCGLSPEESIVQRQPAPRNDAQAWMIHLGELASSCTRFCRAIKCSNPLYVFLLARCNTLESIISGEASLKIWRAHADCVAVATFLGMHNDVETKITLCSELRRRVYARLFNSDKLLCAFVGRPPLLSRRFSSTPLPLDIADDVLVVGEPALSEAVASLNANGWHKDGTFHHCTTMRARAKFAVIRDAILELALGVVPEEVKRHALELKQQAHLPYEQLPFALLYRPEDILDRSVPRSLLFSALIVRLGHLQNLFLLERLLVKCGDTSGQDLLDIAKEMLGLIVGVFKHQGWFKGLEVDFEWLMLSFAVPASGTLCAELVKQAKYPHSPKPLTIPRSETIQNLSLLVAFLDWVQPSAPNGELCHRVKEILSRVLDQLLNSSVAAATETETGSGGVLAEWDLELPGDFLLFEECGNVDLMGTFDWLG